MTVSELPVAPADTRAAWVDRLRVVGIAGVVVVHVGTASLVPIGWYYEERIESELLEGALFLLIAPLANFGLGPLFVVGGMMAAHSLARRGPASFVRARLLRLGVPVLVVFFLVDPVADFWGTVAEGGDRPLSAFLSDFRGDRDIGVFWFVLALLAFNLVYAAWRGFRAAPRASGGELAAGVLGTLALLIVATDAVVWLRWDYLTEHLWNLRWAQWPQSGALFVLGVVLAERRLVVTRALARWCGILAAGGTLAFLVALVLGTRVGVDGADLTLWGNVAVAPVSAVVALAFSVWVLDLFRRHDPHVGPIEARAARASYAAYLVHPLVLVALSAAARPIPWSPAAKFVLVATVGVPTVFAVGHLLTRIPGVRRVL